MLPLPGCGGKQADPVLESEKLMVTQGVEILRDGTSVQRDSVIRTFNNLENSQLLHPYLKDTDAGVRIGIVSALGNLKDQAATGELNAMLLASDDYLLREVVIWALGELGDTSSVPVLISIMQDTTETPDLRLGMPITLSQFISTAYAGKVEQAFVDVLRDYPDDIELCSYVAVGILEILEPGNYELFQKQLPVLKELAAKRLSEEGEDGIYTNFQLTIDELENFKPDAV
ncbi:HEAT repeat domain-containing protein [Gemmatimonadota bacterium]